MATSVIPISTYLQPDDAERLRALARTADRSIAGEIRHAIRRHLETSESPAGQPGSRDDDSGVEAAGNVYPAD